MLGPIEAVRAFTFDLTRARRLCVEPLGLDPVFAGPGKTALTCIYR